MRTPTINDLVVVNPGRNQRSGRVTKVLEPKAPSPGGIVVENETHIFWVAPWEHVSVSPLKQLPILK